MKAADYNKWQYEQGLLTQKHIQYLGKFPEIICEEDPTLWSNISIAAIDFQKKHDLNPDGKIGEKTRAAIESEIRGFEKLWPVYGYKGRYPFVTSGYGPRPTQKNPDAFHHGFDIYLPWVDGDPVDEKYCYRFRSGPNKGKIWCWYPEECRVIFAVAPGVVILSGQRSNGYRYWVDHRQHGLDLCTGYLHLDKDTALVDQGAEVHMGEKLAAIWGKLDDPHLHYEELDSISPYKPRKPDMNRAKVLFEGD